MSGILNILASAVGVVKDTYFNLVTLLLNTSSTNGAQNNTFLDSSSNAFSITRNGNTTQGTFTPFSQTGWSNYFTASDCLNGTYGANVNVTSSNTWTVECEFYATSFPTQYTCLISRGDNGTGNTSRQWALQINTSGSGNNVAFYYNNAGADNSIASTGVTISLNTWHHIAVSSNAGSVSVYFDGNRVATGTISGTNASTANARICNFMDYTTGTASACNFNGYISNLRFVAGTALYSGTTITVPNSSLTAISGTSLLTCQSNRFVDNSSNNFTFSVTGSPSVQAFSPFAPTAAYSTTTVGGSGYFDGTGDYLTIATNSAFAMGSGNFTIEFWFNSISATSGSCRAMSNIAVGGTFSANTWAFALNTASFGISFYCYNFSSSSPMLGSSNTSLSSDRAWHHCAVTRSGNTWSMYIDGVLQGSSVTSSVALDAGTTYPLTIGWTGSTGDTNFNGYLSSLRLVKSQSLSSGNFTPPTAPVTTSAVGWTGANAATSLTGTVSLLTNFTNAGIYDAAAKNDLETVGNAQVSTTQAKFGTTSIYFDGTGDWLSTRMTENLVLRSDFTLEAWVYPTTITGSSRTILFLENGANSATFYISSSGILSLDIAGVANYTLGSTAVTTNSWQYIAFVRSGSTLTGYINGSSVGTATVTASIGSTGSCLVGANSGSGGAPFFGYIDELRLTKGYARTITTPTAAFPVQ